MLYRECFLDKDSEVNDLKRDFEFSKSLNAKY